MTTLRTLVILARTLVILTIGIAGAAVIDSLIAEHWHAMVISFSRANETNR